MPLFKLKITLITKLIKTAGQFYYNYEWLNNRCKRGWKNVFLNEFHITDTFKRFLSNVTVLLVHIHSWRLLLYKTCNLNALKC